MLQSYVRFWRGYGNWEGKSTRADFWWTALCHSIAILALLMPIPILFNGKKSLLSVTIFTILGLLYFIYSLAIVVPNISLTLRRLRDAGFHWAFIFLNFIPVFGTISCFILLQFPSKASPSDLNRDKDKDENDSPQDNFEHLKQNLIKSLQIQMLTTKKSFLSLSTSDDKTTTTSSKIGGYGYLSRKFKYPTNADGQPLHLLAQVNFSEMPYLEPLPRDGILAFYVDYFDDLIGADLYFKSQKGYKVYYFNDVSLEHYTQNELADMFIPFKGIDRYEIVTKEQKLFGKVKQCFPSYDPVEFEQKIGNTTIYDDVLDDFFETVDCANIETGIGCYPFFTQNDPRYFDKELENEFDYVLFQLDSDYDNVMWGDSGIGNFFINSEKLKRLDFSNVLYN